MRTCYIGNSQNRLPKADPFTFEGWGALLFYAAAAIALGYALEIHNPLDDVAIFWLSAALVLTLVGLLLPKFPHLENAKEQPVLALTIVGVVFQLWHLLITTAGVAASRAAIASALAVLPFAAALVLKREWARGILLPLFLAAHFCCGVAIIRHTPDPAIDVYLFHRQAIESVLHGANPHAGTIPNIYQHTDFYGPGIVKDGRVQVGFPYPPLSLLFSLAGHLIAGDHRYALLVAMTLTGALLAYARPGIPGPLAALIFLTTPRIFYLLALGWSDPYVVLLFAATVFSACRAPKFLPWSLGLLLAIKQYTILVLPFVLFLLPQPVEWRELTRVILKAIALAVALTLPMMLWNPDGFLNDVVYFQFRQPFRTDSLSLLAWLARDVGLRLPTWLGFVLVVPTIVLGLWRAPRTPTGFAGAIAAVYIVFFAFSKQAFANYYIFVIGALCCAIGAKLPRAATLVQNKR